MTNQIRKTVKSTTVIYQNKRKNNKLSKFYSNFYLADKLDEYEGAYIEYLELLKLMDTQLSSIEYSSDFSFVFLHEKDNDGYDF